MPRTIAHTLARNQLGVPAILAIIVAAAAPMSVVFGGAVSAFATTGLTAIPLAYLVIAVLLALWAPGYLSLSHLANAGSTYSYLRHGLGRVPGVAGAGVAVTGYNMMQIGFYGGFGLAAAQFTSALGASSPWWAWALGAWVLVGLLGVRKIDLSGRVLLVLLAGEVLVLLVFSGVYLTHGPAGPDTTALNPAQLGDLSTFSALAIAFAGFVGLEGCTAFSEEAKSRKAMTRAILAAIVLIGVLYALGTWAVTVAAGPAQVVGAANSESTDLAFTLAAPHVPQWVVLAAHLLYATSMFAGLLAWHNVTNRYHFALGREGVLPGWLASTSRQGGPRAAALAQTTLAGLALLIMLATGADPMSVLFYGGTVSGGFAVLILLVTTGIAVLSYWARTRRGRPHPLVLTATILGTLGLAVVLVVTLLQFHLVLGVEATSPARWILPGVFGVAALAGAGWALTLRSLRPHVWRRLGYGTSAALIDAQSTHDQTAHV